MHSNKFHKFSISLMYFKFAAITGAAYSSFKVFLAIYETFLQLSVRIESNKLEKGVTYENCT
jgi:hypothetical protein